MEDAALPASCLSVTAASETALPLGSTTAPLTGTVAGRFWAEALLKAMNARIKSICSR